MYTNHLYDKIENSANENSCSSRLVLNESYTVNEMDEKGKGFQWDIIVETCFDQKTKFNVINTISVRDLKLLCELEFAIPSDLQVFIHENMELENSTKMSSLCLSNTQTITLKMHVVPGLQSFVSSCMKGDIEKLTKGIRDKTNQSLNVEDRAFVATFIAAGARRCELLSLLLRSKELFVDINKRIQLSRRSVLHAAVAGGDLSCVVNVMVMTHGLDLLHFEDEGHETPLDLARRLQKPTLVQLLEKYEEIRRQKKTCLAEGSEEEKTHVEAISLDNTSSNDIGLTSNENQNAHKKDQVSESNIIRNKDCQSDLRSHAETFVTQLNSKQDPKQNPNFTGMEKKVLEVNDTHSNKNHEGLDRRSQEYNSLSPHEVRKSKSEKSEESSVFHKTQKEKTKNLQQKSKTRFRNSSLKLHIPLRNRKKNVQENTSSLRQQPVINPSNETRKSVERTLENSGGKIDQQVHTERKPISTSPCKGTVPKIKILSNMEDLQHHVNSHAHTTERLSPTTENLITTQRPFSAQGHSFGSPTMSRRLICGRPRSSTIEKDRYHSQSPPRTSSPGICIPHPPDSPLSVRRRSWSPSPDLVAKISPILQRKFGSAYELQRPRSGSLKTCQVHVPSQGFGVNTLPVGDCKQFELLRQNMPLQSLSAPNSPQSSRKRLTLKINQELEELHHRFYSTRSQAQTLNHRRGSLPGNIWKDTNNKDRQESPEDNMDTKHKQGKPFDIWLKEKEDETARKHAFELAATKAVEKLADETWSEIRLYGKTYEQWRREKDDLKSHRDCHGECNDTYYGECNKKALRYEEWLKRKDEEDLKREEIRRQEAARQFEENRRKREIENERKMARLKKHDS